MEVIGPVLQHYYQVNRGMCSGGQFFWERMSMVSTGRSIMTWNAMIARDYPRQGLTYMCRLATNTSRTLEHFISGHLHNIEGLDQNKINQLGINSPKKINEHLEDELLNYGDKISSFDFSDSYPYVPINVLFESTVHIEDRDKFLLNPEVPLLSKLTFIDYQSQFDQKSHREIETLNGIVSLQKAPKTQLRLGFLRDYWFLHSGSVMQQPRLVPPVVMNPHVADEFPCFQNIGKTHLQIYTYASFDINSLSRFCRLGECAFAWSRSLRCWGKLSSDCAPSRSFYARARPCQGSRFRWGGIAGSCPKKERLSRKIKQIAILKVKFQGSIDNRVERWDKESSTSGSCAAANHANQMKRSNRKKEIKTQMA
ncbi:hypothetical protein RND71_032159 [Anisodus tanguticus]|uniref:Uncharacterized protein n=1 Tax=Anisodus tanguticus TaxID=243964 RepID=A0AAE1V5K3_9SOLA|nr:hypothetical protein RND71_032159 [Anisodus tanguticus]